MGGKMRRLAAKVDANQDAIVRALCAAGAAVQSLASVGVGCPDLLVGHGGRNYLLEVKRPDVPTSDRELTEYQRKWHKHWLAHGGAVVVVETVSEALVAAGFEVVP
jgi:hypothetical protein